MNLDPAAAGTPDAPRYGGFWIRVWAGCLDLLLLGALQNVVLAAVYGRTDLFTSPAFVHSPLYFVLSWVAPTVFVVGFWIWRGATPGKMICGLRIIDARTGGHPTAWQFVGRYVMSFLSMAIAGIGMLWVAIDPRKQAWHDKIVGTLVIRTRP